PAVGARAGVVVREPAPGVAVGAVVLADGPPGPFADVRAPALPRDAALAALPQPVAFDRRLRRGQVCRHGGGVGLRFGKNGRIPLWAVPGGAVTSCATWIIPPHRAAPQWAGLATRSAKLFRG